MLRLPLQRWLTPVVSHGLLVTWCALMLFPWLYAVLTSFKDQATVLTAPPTLLPPDWSLEGYQQVWHSFMVRYYLPNTLVNSVVASLLIVPVATLAGYAFSRYRFRGSVVLQFAVLVVMMMPGLTNLVPVYGLASSLHLLDSHAIMIAVYTGGGVPLSIWLMRSFLMRFRMNSKRPP